MAKIIFNPKNGSEIKGFVWSHAKWNLKVGEIKKFTDEVADGLLKHCGFLIEVTKDNAKEIKKMTEQKAFKCPHCEFSTNTKVALTGHLRTHAKEIEAKEEEIFGVVADAVPSQKLPNFQERKIDIEAAEGIPAGGTKSNPAYDKDGVGFYGEGLAKDDGKE